LVIVLLAEFLRVGLVLCAGRALMFGIGRVVHAHGTYLSTWLPLIVFVEEIAGSGVLVEAYLLKLGLALRRIDKQSREWTLPLFLFLQLLLGSSAELAQVLRTALVHCIVLFLHVATLIPGRINSNI